MRPKRTVTDPRTLRAMAHPLRLSIMEQLTVLGPLTASQLGDRLDESPANCSWHLRKLAEHGFVEEAQSGGGRQRPWQVTQIGMRWGDTGEGPALNIDEAMASQALTDVFVGREVARLHDSQVRLASDEAAWRRASATSQSMLWLTAEELDEITNAVRALYQTHMDRHDHPDARPPGARLCALVGWGVPTYGVADEVPAAEESLSMRGVFSQHGFRRLFTGVTTSMFGDSVMLLVLSMWVKSLTGSNAAAGLTFFWMLLPSLSAPLLGVLVDRFRPKQVLVWGSLVSAVVVLPLLLVHGAADVWLVYVVGFFYGFSFIILPAALNGLLKELVDDQVLVEANATLTTVKQGFRLVGPLVGAALFVGFGGGAVAVLDAASFVVAAVVVGTIRTPERPAVAAQHQWWREMTAGARHLVAEPLLRHTLITLGLMLLVLGFTEASIYAVADAFAKPVEFVSVIVAVQGVGAVVGGLTATRVVRRIGEVGAVVVGTTVMAVSLGILAATHSLWVLLAAVVVFGSSIPVIVVAFTTLVQRRTPIRIMGRVSAATEVVTGTPQAVSIAGGALLVTLLDYHVIYAIMAAVIAVAAGYLVLALGRRVWQPVEPWREADDLDDVSQW